MRMANATASCASSAVMPLFVPLRPSVSSIFPQPPKGFPWHPLPRSREFMRSSRESFPGFLRWDLNSGLARRLSRDLLFPAVLRNCCSSAEAAQKDDILSVLGRCFRNTNRLACRSNRLSTRSNRLGPGSNRLARESNRLRFESRRPRSWSIRLGRESARLGAESKRNAAGSTRLMRQSIRTAR
jgi:hypothetical protein